MSLSVSPTSVVAGKTITISAKGFLDHESVVVWDYTGPRYKSSKDLTSITASSHGTTALKHKTNSSISASERRQRICLQGKHSKRLVCARYTIKLTAAEAPLPEEAELPEETSPPQEGGSTPPLEGANETEAEEKERAAEKKKAEEKKKVEKQEEAEEEGLEGISGHVSAGTTKAHASAVRAAISPRPARKMLRFSGQTSEETGVTAVAFGNSTLDLVVSYPPETRCEGNVHYLLNGTVDGEEIPLRKGHFSYSSSGQSAKGLYTGYSDSYAYTLQGHVRGHTLTGSLKKLDTIYGPTGAVLGACSTSLSYTAKAR